MQKFNISIEANNESDAKAMAAIAAMLYKAIESKGALQVEVGHSHALDLTSFDDTQFNLVELQNVYRHISGDKTFSFELEGSSGATWFKKKINFGSFVKSDTDDQENE